MLYLERRKLLSLSFGFFQVCSFPGDHGSSILSQSCELSRDQIITTSSIFKHVLFFIVLELSPTCCPARRDLAEHTIPSKTILCLTVQVWATKLQKASRHRRHLIRRLVGHLWPPMTMMLSAWPSLVTCNSSLANSVSGRSWVLAFRSPTLGSDFLPHSLPASTVVEQHSSSMV